ncbi:MAG: efflux RND transporter permease subunit [Chromatiaceae bacterium]|nr:efflux RND transporter permease subunit [Gammaproteobacteria bacterium]MCP5316508.1 efflux RND transporter permease subunit [Chromatiaceae bacterium]MCW5586986.1 efflux RND transporter permease subunit [Chromatiales bacterium]MCP5429468.1 efflux RND transporter permease subunit [Chromatiaceae bacterium]MCP5434185.1 efflux RND transporter permease subunit [Chromatiaceae bacterium]
MDSITDLFIRRPVLAIVLNLLIVIAGLSAWHSLSVRQYPLSENASVQITTAYVGASAELVRGFITTPLERAIAAAEGIDYVESKSLQGISLITARLKLNYDSTKALADISSKVDQVRNDLPVEAQVPAISVQSADSEFAAAYLSFWSEILSPEQITDYLTRVVQPRLSAVAGVQRIEIFGARTFAMRVWLKPDRMAAMRISPAQVRAALASNNYLAAIGATKGALVQTYLAANTDMHSPADFRRLVIYQKDDTIVRLEDIADVELGAEDYDTLVRYSGQTAVFAGVFPQPNANIIDVIGGVRVELDKLKQEMPAGLDASIGYDASEYVSNAIHEVTGTLADTLLIVVIVIFLFLGSVRSVLVPVMAIPVSLIGGIFLMQVFGFTLNLLTLLAIVLSVGLVVDDAIVVVENVERHLREGRSPREAAMLGARELLAPVVAMTLTLVAVYIPIGLQGGLTGALFREFAFTLAGAVAISGVVALTLSPTMAGKLLRSAQDEERGLSGWLNHRFDRLSEAYGRALGSTLGARPAVYLVWVIVSLCTVPMFTFSPKELAPTEDQSVLFGIINTAANATTDQNAVYAEAAEKIMLDVPEAALTFQLLFPPSVGATLGADGFSGVVVKPWAERNRTVTEILPEVQARVSKIPGIQVFITTPPALPGGSNFPVEFVITSTADAERLLEIAQVLQQKATASGLFAFPPTIDMKIDQPQATIVFDRDKLADLGLNLSQVGADLAVATGGDFVNRFNMDGRSYKVIPLVRRADRLNSEQLVDIHVTGPDGQMVPLASVAHIEHSVVARSLNRFQQLNAVKLSGVSTRTLDDALKFLEEAAQEILPPGYGVDYTGESRQLRTEGNKFLPAFSLAVLMIFLVLAVQFNSFRDPFVILAGSVPLAMFGALIFTVLKIPDPNMPYWTNGWTTTMNIYAQVGLVTLVGLIAKNGILIVEFANKLQEQGEDKLDAVRNAAMIRLRPVLMTSVATIAGHFPLVLVTGAGAAARNSIGLVLVGGMAIGTLFTLFVVPSLYMLMAKDRSAARHAST